MSDQTEFAKVLSAGGVLPPDDTGRRPKPEQTTGPKRHKAADRFAMLLTQPRRLQPLSARSRPRSGRCRQPCP